MCFEHEIMKAKFGETRVAQQVAREKDSTMAGCQGIVVGLQRDNINLVVQSRTS